MKSYVKNVVEFMAALVVIIGFGGLLLAGIHGLMEYNQKHPVTSREQIVLDKFVSGESISLDDARLLSFCSMIEAEIWCQRHHVPGDRKKATAQKIFDAYRGVQIKIEPLFPPNIAEAPSAPAN